jgi:hypothetical protein
MLLKDEMDTENTLPLLDSLHEFLLDRYLIPEVAYLACHDFICGIIRHSSTSLSLQLFGDQLNGHLDTASFRYVMLLCDFISLVDWESAQDFKPFATAIYPFLSVCHSVYLCIILPTYASTGIFNYNYNSLSEFHNKLCSIRCTED